MSFNSCKGLPYDEEVEIDELTLRRLFEDIVLKARDMMGDNRRWRREMEAILKRL